jgi:hypothetical protein
MGCSILNNEVQYMGTTSDVEVCAIQQQAMVLSFQKSVNCPDVICCIIQCYSEQFTLDVETVSETAAKETLDRSRRGGEPGTEKPRADGAGRRAMAAVGR